MKKNPVSIVQAPAPRNWQQRYGKLSGQRSVASADLAYCLRSLLEQPDNNTIKNEARKALASWDTSNRKIHLLLLITM